MDCVLNHDSPLIPPAGCIRGFRGPVPDARVFPCGLHAAAMDAKGARLISISLFNHSQRRCGNEHRSTRLKIRQKRLIPEASPHAAESYTATA
jgi:hypothetical protein